MKIKNESREAKVEINKYGRLIEERAMEMWQNEGLTKAMRYLESCGWHESSISEWVDEHNKE